MDTNTYMLSNMKVDVKRIEEIIRKASTIMTERDFNVEYKDGFENIVTSSDLAVQQFLCKNLAAVIPDSGFLCEENNAIDTKDKRYVWIIDPIDGTTNYSRNISEFCISVALTCNNEVVFGAVYNPVKDEMFIAEKGNGATLNGRRIGVSHRRFEEGIMCTAMSLYNKQYAKQCSDIIYDVYMQSNDVRRFGSCALELCYLAMGLCELYFEYRVMPWDYAAAYLILTEAGGVLTEYNGEPLTLDRPAMLIGANNEENHSKLKTFITNRINPNDCSYEWRKW